MTPIIALAALIVFSGASFFFALAETSLFSLGKWQVRQLKECSPGPGQIISRLLAAPQDLLATLVLGNSFANAGIVAVMLWVVVHHGWPMTLVMSGVLLGVLFVGEAAPKTLAVRAPELWSCRVAAPMLFLQNSSRPLRRIAQYLTNTILGVFVPVSLTPPAGLSDAEYQELLEMAYQQGALAAGEKEIILQIISLDRRQARDVMKGRTQIISIPDDLSLEEMVAAARRARHSRLPIYDETPDTIVGVLNTQALLLDPHQDLANVFEFPSFVPESMNLLQLLKSLQRQRRGLAIVLDEFGGTAGIVTVEDILAEVLGELRREHEPDRAVLETTGPGRWRVGGSVRLDNFRREYPPLDEIPGVETMAGLALHEFQVVPAPGESVIVGGLRLTVRAADERRIRELLVEVVKKEYYEPVFPQPMTDQNLLTALVLLLCTALSFLFSGMESGVLALNHFRIRQLSRAGDPRAAVLHGCLENPEDFLWTILVGNTVVNFIIFSVSLVKLRSWLHGLTALWLMVFALAVFVFYIVCELLPKTLFQRYPNRLTLGLARPFRLIHRFLAPLVALVAWFSRGLLKWTGGKTFTGRLFGSRDELRFVMQESAPNLTSEEKHMINRVLDLQNLRVRHVTIPMAAAASVPSPLPMSDVLALCWEKNFSRIPVLDIKTGRVAGVINLEWVLYADDLDRTKPARDYMEPAFFLPEELHLEEALRRMQATGHRLAIVFSVDRGETGVVSLEDILRVIFGEVNL